MNFLINHEFVVRQDGLKIFQADKTTFKLVQGLDTRFNEKRIDLEVYDFVGFVFKESSTLVVLPKHFYSESIIKALATNGESPKEDDIHLLFDVMQKYILNKQSSALKYLGHLMDYESDYPFFDFFAIYNYYRQFGIYQDKITKTTTSPGKISWKDTIRKSNKIYDNGNIIHLPLFTKQNKSKQVFISDCMGFAIDYTLERFSFLLSMPKTGHKIFQFDFFENIDYVIRHLQSYRNEVFKDIHKKLLNDLISFYTQLEGHKRGGDVHIKIKHFNLVWEEMIGHYLNRHFKGIENENSLIFDINLRFSETKFKKRTFAVDKSPNSYKIQPDHYYADESLQYIFDAKYYDNEAQLNYKQYSYHEMLRGKKPKDNTISAIILPSEDENNSHLHFSLSDDFVSGDNGGTTIIAQKVKLKDVMLSYIKS